MEEGNNEKDIQYYLNEKFKNKLKYQTFNSADLYNKKEVQFIDQENNIYLQELIQKIDPSEFSNGKSKDTKLQTNYYQNIYNRDQFLILKLLTVYKTNQSIQDNLVTSQLLFYKFCNVKNEMVLQSVVLYDIFQGFQKYKDKSDHSNSYFPFSQNSILNQGQTSFYFLKQVIKEQKILQLHKHTILNCQELNDSNLSREINVIQDKIIILPNDIQLELEEVVTGFFEDATPGVSRNSQQLDPYFLDKQFVYVQSWSSNKSLLIYQIENTKNPLVRFIDDEIESIVFAFFTRLDGNKVIFTLKCRSTHVQIEVKIDELNDQCQVFNTQNDDRVKIVQQEMKIESYPFQTTQYQPLHLQIQSLKTGKTNNQSYFIHYQNDFSDPAQIELIYPIQDQSETQIQKNQLIKEESYVNQQIRKKHNIGNNKKNHLALFFNNKINFIERNESVIQFLESQGLSNKYQDSLLCYDEVIINLKNNIIELFYFQEKIDYFSFKKTFTNVQNQNNKFLLSKALDNFKHQENKQIYHQIYKCPFKHIWQQAFNLKDEYIENYYINRRKKGVFMTHQKVYINEQEFKFDQRCLPIDLSQTENEENPFRLLKLYAPDVNNIKLLKYHTSDNCAIFFFVYIVKKYLDQQLKIQESFEENTIGVNFFVIKQIQDLKILIKQNKFLIEKESIIFIPMEIDNIIKEKFNEDQIIKYCGWQKITCKTSNDIQFEIIRDLNSPQNQYFPFIYNNKTKGSWLGFEHYLCFINIEEISKHLKYIEQDEDDINFDVYLYTFKINYYQDMLEESNIFELNHDKICYRNYIPSQGFGRSQNMFSMSSNWQKNLNKDKIDNYSAIFQFGINLYFSHKGVQQLEIREYLINFNIQKKNKSAIQVKPIHLKHATFSQDYIKGIYTSFDYVNWVFQRDAKVPMENNILLPNIDDDGRISSSIVLLNYYQSQLGVYKIVRNLDSQKEWFSQDMYRQIKQKEGQQVFICKADSDTFDGYFSDRKIIKNLKYSILQEYVDEQLLDPKLSPQEFIKKYRKPEFLYDIIDFSEIENQNDQIIVGPYSQSSNQIISHENNSLMKIFLSSSQLSKNCILNDYFSHQQSIYELYELQKNVLCMSLFNIQEIINLTYNLQRKYFQPRQIFNGKNLCSIQLEYNEAQINQFKKAIDQNDIQYEYIENSVIDKASFEIGIDKKNIFLKSLNINQYYQFLTDFTCLESIFQKAIEQSKFKIVNILLEHFLLDKKNLKMKWVSLNQNFPQLLNSAQFNFNQFFEYSIDEQNQDKSDENNQFLNFMLKMNNQQLARMGEQQIYAFYFQNIENQFQNLELINNNYIEVNNKMRKDSNEQVAVEHFMFNFQNTIRKIKIDLISGRLQNENQFTDYLERFDQNQISQLNSLNELFISELIIKNSQNNQFMELNIIKSLIDITFQKTQDNVKQLLYLHIFGFYLPYLYNTFVINYNLKDQNDQNEYFHKIFMYILYFVMLITQLIFVLFEISEMRQNGMVRYFKDGWNYFDFSQPIFFLILLIIKIGDIKIQVFNFKKLFVQIVQIIVLIQSSSRILQYIRVNESFCYLILMLTQVQIDLLPFMAVFIICSFIFGLILIIMGADGNNESGDYLDLPPYLRIMFQSFRISLGDVQINQYGVGWGNEKNKDPEFLKASPFAKSIIWIFWIFNLYFMLIIMLNFLIAEVSQTYEKVKSQGEIQIYRQKAELNKLILQIKLMFGFIEEFEVIVYQKPQENTGTQIQDEYTSMTEKVKLNTQLAIQKLKIKQDERFNSIEMKQNQFNEQQLLQTLEIKNLKEVQIQEIKNLKNEMQEFRKDQQDMKQMLDSNTLLALKYFQKKEQNE